MRVSSDRAAALYRAAGAQVAGQLVRFDLGMVGDLLRNVPPAFTLSARNPACNLSLGGNNVVFASVGGLAFMVDNGKGRREGKFAEMWDYLKLVQSPNVIHQEGGGRSSRWICLRTSGICTAIRRRSLTLIRLATPVVGPRPHDGRDCDDHPAGTDPRGYLSGTVELSQGGYGAVRECGRAYCDAVDSRAGKRPHRTDGPDRAAVTRRAARAEIGPVM